MFEFEVIQELKANDEILEIIKGYNYTVKNGKIKHLKATNLQYDKKEMCKYFDNLLKEINIEYRTTTINFANYPYTIFVSSKIMEMDSVQQNRVALYLFNSINFKIKNCKSLDNKEQMF